MNTIKLENALNRHPRMAMAHLPTRIERMSNMSDEMELELWVKRDDCTGIGFGGNKVRQLEYYFGKAQMMGADTVLITGAIQSNYVRTAAASRPTGGTRAQRLRPLPRKRQRATRQARGRDSAQLPRW